MVSSEACRGLLAQRAVVGGTCCCLKTLMRRPRQDCVTLSKHLDYKDEENLSASALRRQHFLWKELWPQPQGEMPGKEVWVIF